MRIARELLVTGTVQGVGFRWTTKRIADSLGVAGWVRNNPDGSVSVAVEGTREELDAFAEQLWDRMGGYIDGVETQEIAAGKNRMGFDVVR